tara:strand:- start:4711 stop:5439 length:729 start_codon:yes stop_codon:yes gene_type:complete
MRCAIYVRSTPAGASKEQQRTMCSTFVNEMSFTISKTYFDEFPKRDSYNQMMAEIDDWDVCVFYSADRIHSSSKDFCHWSVALKKNHRNFAIVSDDVHTLVSNSRQIFDVLEATLACDNALIQERTSAGMKKVSSIGRKIGKPPYGYDSKYKLTGKAEDKGVLVVNDSQADIVRIIFACWEQRMSKNEIAKHLRDNNILTKAGKSEWASSTVRGIIDNKLLYEGKYMDEQGNEVKYDWEPII